MQVTFVKLTPWREGVRKKPPTLLGLPSFR